MGGLQGITGLKVLRQNNGSYIMRGFHVGFVLVYDKEDCNKCYFGTFTINENVDVHHGKIYNNVLEFESINEYGTLVVTGGSGNYSYSSIGF